MSVVQTRALTRRFGPVTAIHDLTVELPASGVIGLIGPNGSGKSTLIRTLLGLIRPTGGDAFVLGKPITTPRAYAPAVGALIERPAFVASLSARANLSSLAHLRGTPRGRIDEVLDRVGLVGRDREPVGRFSLGMKQRLGIAAALLNDPTLLVLDEPTNGLDPAGIVEIRELLRSLAADGRTVIVSSHLLSELQAVCDHLVIMRFGELLFAGPLAAIRRGAGAHLEIAPEHEADSERLVGALRAGGFEATLIDGGLRVDAAAERAADINRAAGAAGITLARLLVVQDSLEAQFLELTGRTDGELAAARSATARGAH